MPRVSAHQREHAVFLLQGGRRTADVCNVRCLRQLSGAGRQEKQLMDHSVANHKCTPKCFLSTKCLGRRVGNILTERTGKSGAVHEDEMHCST